MKRAPWLAVPIGAVDGLICTFEQSRESWPRAAASLDLARHLDLAASGRARFPSRRTLAERWRWTEASVRGLLLSRHEWSDPTKETEEPAARPTLAQHSPNTRPPETVGPAQFGDYSPNTRPTLAQRSPKGRPNVLPDSLENLAFEYGLSEVGTMGDTTTTKTTTHKNNNTYVLGGEPDPTLLSILLTATRNAMKTDLTGSRPKTDADPIDNDGDKTHPPEASAPSLPSTDDTASATTPATAQPSLAAPSVVAPDEGQGTVGAFIWLDKPIPAPKRAPKSKPKTKGKPDDAAILAIAAQVDRLKGRPGAALPGSGRWKMLVTAANEAGADRVLARVTAMADAAQGLPSPASAVFAQMSGSDWGTDPILRGNNGWTVKLDDAIDAQRASEATGAAGGVVGRVEPQNAPERQPAPKQNGSSAWDDMLAVIRSTGGMRLSLGLRGSTLSHDPAEHARRCRAVADIGGWAKLCELNDFNRMAIRAQWIGAYDRVGVTA